jgi:WD40 repeat protein
MSAATTSFYQTGGTLRPDAPSYVERQADRDLCEGLSGGEFCYVLTARQMGKSSLMARVAARLREQGTTVLSLDLSAIGQNLTPEQWYDGLLRLIAWQLDLDEELEAYWQANARLGPLQRWMGALREVVMLRCPGRVVIAVDEIDAVRSLPFSTDEFFAGIRECYNRRSEDPKFARLTFCLLGVASPADLIRDTRTTPFNIGRRIELTDFTEAEAAPLVAGLGRKQPLGRVLLARALYWTSGHPYLTQRLCQAVAEATALTGPEGVDRLCRELFLSSQARERDDNLLFVRDWLLRSEADLASLLELYRRVRRGRHVRADETNPLVSRLRLSGITRSLAGDLRPRNRIYERVFDSDWITAHMPDAELRRQRAAYRRGLVRATALLGAILVIVGGLALTALSQAHRAQERQHMLRRSLYGAQMFLAQQAWEAGDVNTAVELLDAQRPGHSQEDLRGFEWRHLWRLCRADARFTLRGHSDELEPVLFSPQGKLVASGSHDGTVRLWDPRTGRALAVLQEHHPIYALAWSPDGRTLSAGGKATTVTLWDVQARRKTTALHGATLGIDSLAFSPDGTKLVGGRGRILTFWDIASRQVIATLKGPYTGFRTAAFSPDGTILATGDRESGVRLWDVARRRQIATLRGHSANVTCVAFSPDGRTLASASDDDTLRLWDVPEHREEAILRGHRSVVYAVAFSPDGKALASGSDDLTIKLWDVATREERTTLRGHHGTVRSVAFSPDGKTLASGSRDSTVKLWDLAPNENAVLQGQKAGVWTVAFSPDGRTLASESWDDSVKLWDVASCRELDTLRLPCNGGRHGIAFSPDGGTLAIGCRDHAVRLWDVPTRRPSGILRGHAGEVVSVAFSPDGRTLASGGAGDLVKFWDVRRRQEVATLHVHQSGISNAVFSPDGRTLAIGSGDRSIQLWDLATRHEIAPFRGHQRGNNDLAFSPDGKILVTCSWDHSVKLWDVATRREVTSLKGITGIPNAVAFSPDGKTLATGSSDRVVKLWELAMKQQVAALTGHRAWVSSVVFSPDGSTLASGSADGTVRLWRAASFAETDAPVGASGRR